MKTRNNTIQFSASDVSSHIGCQYLTQLKLKAARKELTWPVFNSVSLDVLREKGQEFERAFLDELKAESKTVIEIDPKDPDAETQTLQAMQQGSHPKGTELSALEHILQEQKTILPAQVVFLDKTWRLHSSISQFNSELFYESRLLPKSENDNQCLEGKMRFAAAGLFYESVEHEGNKNCSEEEVERVKKIVKELIKDTMWVDKEQQKRKLTKDDILVIAPYNAQVHDLAEALPGLRVGTVDKFQGQEAPVVIFSMATSTPEDAPRGMEFLYSLNRMNVAVSRAKAVFILVASTKLFEPDCKSPGQMKLANAFCQFTEMANMP